MRNLLSAGFARLWRCRMLWISCAFLAATDAVAMWTRYMDRIHYDVYNSMDTGFFYYAVFIGVLVAVVCAMFLGAEYGDGTIRNKMVTGHRRQDVYLANLVLCSVAALIMCTSAVLSGLALGLPLLGSFRMGMPRAVLSILSVYALSLAFASIFTLLAMMITNRTISAVAAILLAITLLLVGAYIDNRLQAKPTVEGFVLTTLDETGALFGDGVVTEEYPNPLYLPDGPVRAAFDFLHDFTPGGQAVQLASITAERLGLLMLYDGIVIAISTVAGLILFRRKDLK